MFENLKAFMQGWKDKGAFPNLPPDLPRPYTDAVISYFEDLKQRMSLRMLVCDSREETVAFDFTYDVLPLSMASAMGYIKNDRDDAKCRYINQALSVITGPLGRSKPTYEIGRVLRDEEEITRLHQIYRLAGSVYSISAFCRTPFPYSTLLNTVYPMRTLAIMKVFAEAAKRQGGQKEIVLAIACQNARRFIADSTSYPNDEKTALIAHHIAGFFFTLCDIPSR